MVKLSVIRFVFFEDLIMTKRKVSSHQQEETSKRNSDVNEEQEGSETLQEIFFPKSSVKKKGLNKDTEVLTVEKFNKLLRMHRKNIEKDLDARFKVLEEVIEAGFNSLREEIKARDAQEKDSIHRSCEPGSGLTPSPVNPLSNGRVARKIENQDSIPKSSELISGFAAIPVQARTPEIEALLKEVTKSTSSEGKSKINISSGSMEFSSASSDEVEEVSIVGQKSSAATTKKGLAPTRRSSRIAGK